MVVVMVSAYLDLRDNTTCQLYTNYGEFLTFYTVDIVSLARDTPLGLQCGDSMDAVNY